MNIDYSKVRIKFRKTNNNIETRFDTGPIPKFCPLCGYQDKEFINYENCSRYGFVTSFQCSNHNGEIQIGDADGMLFDYPFNYYYVPYIKDNYECWSGIKTEVNCSSLYLIYESVFFKINEKKPAINNKK